MDPILVALVAVAGFFIVFVLIRLRMRCPNCGTRLPMVRMPADTQEAAWGGWTCSKCGMKLDRSGKQRR